jgi:hypothetical protein
VVIIFTGCLFRVRDEGEVSFHSDRSRESSKTHHGQEDRQRHLFIDKRNQSILIIAARMLLPAD